MLELLAAIAKALTYGAALTASGLTLARISLRPRPAPGATFERGARLVGGATVLSALVTGVIYVFRLGGVFDIDSLSAIFLSPLGASLGLQVCGGLLLMLGWNTVLEAVAAILLVISFGVVGHSAAKSLAGSISVVLHVTAVGWWLGGLWLLLGRTGEAHRATFTDLVHRFSAQAVWAVALLLLAAFVTAGILLDFKPDFSQAYDRTLALKVGLVGVLLGLAAVNRWSLTPRLGSQKKARTALGSVIVVEILIFACLFAATAFLTTWLSPHRPENSSMMNMPMEHRVD